MFFNNKLKKLQEQQNIIYKYFRTGDNIREIEDYFDIYLLLMRKNIGNIDGQTICSSVFAKYLTSFVIGETNHLNETQIEDMRFAAKKILVDLKNGYPSE